MGSLRGLFTNLTPAQNYLVKRWKRGVYRSSQRGGEGPIRDVWGPVVGTIATPQTFLSAAEIGSLVDDYLAGATVAELAAKYKVHRATVSKHLTRQGVIRRTLRLHCAVAQGGLPATGSDMAFQSFAIVIAAMLTAGSALLAANRVVQRRR